MSDKKIQIIEDMAWQHKAAFDTMAMHLPPDIAGQIASTVTMDYLFAA